MPLGAEYTTMEVAEIFVQAIDDSRFFRAITMSQALH